MLKQILLILAISLMVRGHPRPEDNRPSIIAHFPEEPLDDEVPEVEDHYMHADRELEDEFLIARNAKLFNTQINDKELDNEFWLNKAKDFVEQQRKKQPNENVAKNVIFFLGDGMSVPTIAATRVYIGGEEKQLSFESFPFTAMSKTYCVDKQVSDSACTATAYLTGVKANDATTGVNAQVTHGSCTDTKNEKTHTESIASWAMKAGKLAGFVTTTRVTHASPQGIYAHNANRDWENDVEVRKSGCNPDEVDDVTEQLVYGEVGPKLKVIFGCGRREWLNETMKDEDGIPGYRNDGKNLINEWQQNKTSPIYVSNKDDLLKLDVKAHSHYLGLFDSSHCTYNLEAKQKSLVRPSLADMTQKAIEILSSQSENGYFLFVEGGRIDHGHHDNQARYAIDETAEFSKTVEKVLEMVNEEDTLILVTADHGHVMTLNGYAPRGNDIFGVSGSISDMDDMTFMTLSYANGLGYNVHRKEGGGRVDPLSIDTSAIDFMFPATVPLDMETHGGEDVPIYAKGPMAHLFSGTIEQHVIPHILAYASCIGNGLKKCDK